MHGSFGVLDDYRGLVLATTDCGRVANIEEVGSGEDFGGDEVLMWR